MTYAVPTGSTVIDYHVGNAEGCNVVEKNEVMHRTDSDHVALEIKRTSGKKGRGEEGKDEKWKIRWDEETIAEYKERLGKMGG